MKYAKVHSVSKSVRMLAALLWLGLMVAAAVHAQNPPDFGSGLTCFGVAGFDTRLYYLDAYGHVVEVGYNSGNIFGSGNPWYANDITNATGAPPAMPKRRSTCFGVGGTDTRVYYLDDNGSVVEIGWNAGGWYYADLGNNVAGGAPPAQLGSPLTCFGVGGQNPRVYYLDDNGHVIELATDQSNNENGAVWYYNDISNYTGAPPAGFGSQLTCFGVGGLASRVYYQDGSGHINELGYENGWYVNDITAATGANPAAYGSGLTCFGVAGFDTRVYYQDGSRHINELGWGADGGWYANDITDTVGAPLANFDFALTCFGVGGTASRVYYTDQSLHVNELGWDNTYGWYVNDITAATGAPQALTLKAGLTCFGVGGTDSRIYYQDQNHDIIELSWQNGWFYISLTL